MCPDWRTSLSFSDRVAAITRMQVTSFPVPIAFLSDTQGSQTAQLAGKTSGGTHAQKEAKLLEGEAYKLAASVVGLL